MDPLQEGNGRVGKCCGRVFQQPFHLGIGQRAQLIASRKNAEEAFPRDHGGRQGRGQVGLLVGELLHMVELQSQPIAQVLEGFLRIRAVSQERFTVLEHWALLRIREACGPLGEHLGKFLLLPGGLVVQRVEKVIVLGAGHELSQGGLAIGSQRKGFNEAEVGVGPDSQRSGQRSGQSSGQNPGGKTEAAEGWGVHGRYRAGVIWKPREAPLLTTHGINKA